MTVMSREEEGSLSMTMAILYLALVVLRREVIQRKRCHAEGRKGHKQRVALDHAAFIAGRAIGFCWLFNRYDILERDDTLRCSPPKQLSFPRWGFP